MFIITNLVVVKNKRTEFYRNIFIRSKKENNARHQGALFADVERGV
jgi:hypothetical protein